MGYVGYLVLPFSFCCMSESNLINSQFLVLLECENIYFFNLENFFLVKAIMSDEDEKTCPLCAEEMDLTDQQLKPCKCGYEVLNLFRFSSIMWSLYLLEKFMLLILYIIWKGLSCYIFPLFVSTCNLHLCFITLDYMCSLGLLYHQENEDKMSWRRVRTGYILLFAQIKLSTS